MFKGLSAFPLTPLSGSGDASGARGLIAGCDLWELFASYGSLRVTAELAIKAGLVTEDCLPLPLLRIPVRVSEQLEKFISILD